MQKNQTIQYIDRISTFLFAALLVLFPLLFSTVTTESFVLPKEVLLTAVVLISLLLYGVKMVAEGKMVLRRTPFDLPLLVLTLVVFISAMLSVNKADSLTAFFPLLLSILLFFLVQNVVKSAQTFRTLLVSFLAGGALLSIWSILSYFKIFPLPMAATKVQNFTPLGALFDQALYLALSFPIAFYAFSTSRKEEKKTRSQGMFPIAALIIALGLLLSVFQLIKPINPTDKLLVLPVETGLQTAFSSISQNTGGIVQGLLFGSGYGTFITDFTRFKQASINTNPDIWFITFFRSSSLVLELLATTGLLGLAAYLFLVFKILKNGSPKGNTLFSGLVLAIVLSFILPFSFTIQTLFIVLLTLYSIYKGMLDENHFYDIELDFVAFKKGLIEGVSTSSSRKTNKTLPVIFFIVFLAFVLVTGFYSARYVMADMLFQKSLVAAAANKGVDTYNYQINAIQLFPYRDGFYRIYSQTNLALANSIASSQTPGSTPNQKTQQTVLTLIQQSISAGRSATSIAPLTYFNWENLSSIYRSLIGFGQNADTFAIAAEQQAVLLDANDPQVYINLGGIYYQLGKYDDAQRQFQLSVNLKNDYANAHYNLGHSLEQKGDLQGALTEYQTVQTLVANSPQNLSKINQEIAAVQSKIGAAQNSQAAGSQSQAQQPPLGISKPTEQLPPQHPPVALPTP